MDIFGDAIVYGFSLYAVARGIMWQARVALLKGLIMAAFGLGVLIEVSHKLIAGVVPTPDLMAIVGLIALGANAVSYFSRGTAGTISICGRHGCAHGTT